MRSYLVREIFYSLQGEGVRAGTPNMFVRFAGCNQHCTRATHGFNCDTVYDAVGSVRMTAQEILEACSKLSKTLSVIFTGGEPCLQLDIELLETLNRAKYYTAIETNGTVGPKPCVKDSLSWITISPKGPIHNGWFNGRPIQEVKYVVRYGHSLPLVSLPVVHKVLSPAFEGGHIDKTALNWCIKLVQENPDWRLSVQQHKGWGIQ